ncbi:3D domain-containing protein [Patescibacteria group bacterium]|nr:3D domain-containing protein [Patescibacteria group bacterium]
MLVTLAVFILLQNALSQPLEKPQETHYSPLFEERKQRSPDSEEYSSGLFTAYTASVEECGKADGITASGKKVKEGYTIACPPQIPFYTEIEIEGLGLRTCEDLGGAIKGSHFDIYFIDKSEAIRWGTRTREFAIVDGRFEDIKRAIKSKVIK